MENPKNSNGRSFCNKGQYWDIFLFFFIVFVVLSGIVYFFIDKLGGVPKVNTNQGFAPAEKGVLPKGTFFK